MTPDELDYLRCDLEDADRHLDHVGSILRYAPKLLRMLDEQRSELDRLTSSQPAGTADLDAARHHVHALLAILDEIGGYRTIEQQDAVRAARKSL